MVTAGSLTYVFYYNTKAQIAEDKEKYKAEMPVKEEPNTIKKQMEAKAKEKAEKERAKKGSKSESEESEKKTKNAVDEDVAHLVQDMYITPLSANDRAYEYEEHEKDEGIFLHPYVIEHKGVSTTLHLKAGIRGNTQLDFNTIIVKCDSGEKQLTFPGNSSASNKAGLVVSSHDVKAEGEIETIMRAIAASNFVQVSIAGHEEENKILSPAEVGRFKNMVKLYDELK